VGIDLVLVVISRGCKHWSCGFQTTFDVARPDMAGISTGKKPIRDGLAPAEPPRPSGETCKKGASTRSIGFGRYKPERLHPAVETKFAASSQGGGTKFLFGLGTFSKIHDVPRESTLLSREFEPYSSSVPRSATTTVVAFSPVMIKSLRILKQLKSIDERTSYDLIRKPAFSLFVPSVDPDRGR
jgi:hypothetical protein